jgi:hypothetical protein
MATTLKQNRFRTLTHKFVLPEREVDSRIFGEEVGFIEKLFGCSHRNLSRPFSQLRIGYRNCLNCGVRKQFNTETLETFGKFYYPPPIDEVNKQLNF